MSKAVKAAIVILTVLFFSACTKQEKNTADDDNKIVEIKEKMFVAHVNDVYLNMKHYMGKTVKFEGMFFREQPDDDTVYNLVVRYGPGGCCGYDAYVGFEVASESYKITFPENNSWVEAVGVIKNSTGSELVTYPYIDLISLNVLEKRGRETVTQ
jgi:uncharacterized membrane protein YcgQ (UPF0703/DUF1980 family)